MIVNVGQMLYQPVGGKEWIKYGSLDEEVSRRYGRNGSNNSRRSSKLSQMEVLALIPFFCVFPLYITFVNKFM